MLSAILPMFAKQAWIGGDMLSAELMLTSPLSQAHFANKPDDSHEHRARWINKMVELCFVKN